MNIKMIYYGVLPIRFKHWVEEYNCDKQFALDLQSNKIDWVIKKLLNGGYGEVVHTFNPQILCFLDDDLAAELIHYVDQEGKFKRFKCNPVFMKKLQLMQPGEVVSDSKEFWGEYD